MKIVIDFVDSPRRSSPQCTTPTVFSHRQPTGFPPASVGGATWVHNESLIKVIWRMNNLAQNFTYRGIYECHH